MTVWDWILSNFLTSSKAFGEQMCDISWKLKFKRFLKKIIVCLNSEVLSSCCLFFKWGLQVLFLQHLCCFWATNFACKELINTSKECTESGITPKQRLIFHDIFLLRKSSPTSPSYAQFIIPNLDLESQESWGLEEKWRYYEQWRLKSRVKLQSRDMFPLTTLSSSSLSVTCST